MTPRLFLIGTARMAAHWRDYRATPEDLALWGDPRRCVQVSRVERLRGYRFVEGDRVIWVPGWWDVPVPDRQPLAEYLAYLLSLARSQGIDIPTERA